MVLILLPNWRWRCPVWANIAGSFPSDISTRPSLVVNSSSFTLLIYAEIPCQKEQVWTQIFACNHLDNGSSVKVFLRCDFVIARLHINIYHTLFCIAMLQRHCYCSLISVVPDWLNIYLDILPVQNSNSPFPLSIHQDFMGLLSHVHLMYALKPGNMPPKLSAWHLIDYCSCLQRTLAFFTLSRVYTRLLVIPSALHDTTRMLVDLRVISLGAFLSGACRF